MRKLPLDATCIGCGYMLRGLTEPRCPECWRTFDPSDDRTFLRPSVQSRIEKFYDRPPGKLHASIAASYFLFILIDSSSPGPSFFLILSGFWVFLALIWDYLIRVVMAWRKRRRGLGGAKFADARLRWIALPACILLISSFFVYPWTMAIRFGLSHKSFEQAAKDFEAGNIGGKGRFIGLYYIRGIREFGPDHLFFETGHGFLDMHGFVHTAKPNSPVKCELFLNDEIAPNWYSGCESF